MWVTTFLIAFLIALVGYVLQLLRQHFSYWSRVGITSEKPSWLSGNLQGALRTRSIVDLTMEFYEKYKATGPFVGYYWFLQPAAFVVDPVLLKNIIIKDFSKFTDRGMFHNEEDDPLSGILFNLDGAKWRNMRTKLTPTFTSGKMKIMYPLLMKVSEEFVKVFNEAVATDDVVEVRDLMARFTSDVIGTCAFGIETSSLKDPKSEFRIMGRKALRKVRYGPLGLAFRMNFPKLAQKLHMIGTVPDVEKYFMDLVKATIEYREQNNVRRNDFMDMLIDMKNNKLMKSESGDELTNLSFGEVAAQAFVFLLAGFETSSTTMGFALYELAQNQEIQQRAREEVLEVLERHNQEFTYDCLKELVYLEQIMNETLRLHTVVPVLTRRALEDYVVPGHTKYIIRKDMTVVIPACAIHRDERFYSNPSEFNPENFSAENVAQRDAVMHIPFGDGPRNCIGMRFGKMQVLAGLGTLLKNFKFTACDKTPIPMVYDKESFLISSEKDIFLKVEKL